MNSTQSLENEPAKDTQKSEQTNTENQNLIPDTVIDLNVGGKHYTTYKATLCSLEGSMLEAMFSGRYPVTKDPKGRYFIDRDGKSFSNILNFLRSGVLLWPKDETAKSQLKLELEYYGLLDYVTPPSGFPESKILTPELEEKLMDFLPEKKLWRLLYQGTRDGFQANNFHSKCDDKGATVTIILTTTGCVFGGYATASWNSHNQYIQDNTAFLFCLKNPSGLSCKCSIKQAVFALYGSSNHGPMFGAGTDLQICDNANYGSSIVNVAHTYQTYQHAYMFTGGQTNTFVVQDIEVFGLQTGSK